MDHYFTNPRVNPAGRLPTADERVAIEEVFRSASIELDDIREQRFNLELEVARSRIDGGLAEALVGEAAEVAPDPYESVIVATVESTGPWVVHIAHSEYPEIGRLRELEEDVSDRALQNVVEIIRTGLPPGDALPSR